MVRSCMVMYFIMSLGFIMIGCSISASLADSLGLSGSRGLTGPVGPTGALGLRGDAGKELGRGDIAILGADLTRLKHSYNSNIERFDLQKGDIDTKALFEHSAFGDKFNLNNPNNQRNAFYASLKYDIADIKIVEGIVKILTNQSDDIVKFEAMSLLSALSDSAQFVSQIISFLEVELDLIKQSKNIAGVSELNFLLMMVFRQREDVLTSVKEILIEVEPYLSQDPIDVPKIRSVLKPIISLDGRVRTKIYKRGIGINNESLQTLRALIESKVNELRSALVP
ncbi:hypothetical protein bcCo53_001148 (plasmid) [Borrelia coriaceae]|nr:hypothetical protein [Borrelia coriaceae]UPA16980.1 hypothetical protein bcCo53_001148 [Borrelia coriaceae]